MKVTLKKNQTDIQMVEMWGMGEQAKELLAVMHQDCFMWDDIYTELEQHGSVVVNIKHECIERER